MSLEHFDSAWNWLGVIPEYQTGRGGYTNLESQVDLQGGHAGATCDLSMLSPTRLQNLRAGHFIVQHSHQREMYAGRITGAPDRSDPQLLLMGPVAFWLQNRPMSHNFGDQADPLNAQFYSGGVWIPQNTANIVKWLLQHNCEASYGIDTSDLSFIQAGTYTLQIAPAWSQTTVGDVINELNSFEGYEFGSFMPWPGRSLTERVKFFWHPPDLTTVNFVVDARTLKQTAKIPPDTSKFANYLMVYYGAATPPAFQTYSGTGTSQTQNGIIWDTVDISGTQPVTTLADANQAAAQYFASEMVEGVETPPINLDLVVDDDTKVHRVNHRFKDHMHIEPGTNFLITGLPHKPKHLKAVDRKVIVHSTVVKRVHHARRSTHTVHRYHSPSYLIARKKSKYRK